ncbi:MAG: tetratricopeptide repeat protein [Myxococcales bacterium]|nr:tetratricopeptide repeat protein [Myxococcota bacterium]MDW8280950.1 tetratricopeptide repeat protein [Myxococcales bacterium]
MRRLSASPVCALLVCVLAGCAAPPRPRAAGIENVVVRLQRDVAKVDRAIEATKRLLALAHSAPYVPDLYMRLAELYAEQSRYQYLISYESDPRRRRAVVSIPARLLKEQAVQLYDRVAREFPDYPDLDKALFFKGHELRELGSYEDMIATFERLVRDFPKSRFRHQALIILGDYHFDRSNFSRAEDYYRKVIADAEGPQHAMARYKLAWSRQNQNDCKGALAFFEAAARTQGPAAAGAAAEPGRKLDIRREALVDSGFCYTEVRRPEEAVSFYRSLAESRAAYLAALSKLARRYHSKGQFKAAAPLYREILEVDPNHEDALEFVQRLYEGLQKSPSPQTVDRDVDIIVRVTALRYFNPATPEATRKAMVHDFEVYARDLATKAQLVARDSGDARLLDTVATAYERYLSFFRDVTGSKESQAIEANLADVLFAARRYIAAGRAYEAVAGRKSTGAAERKSALFSAAAAYAQALKASKQLSPYEGVAARAGLYRVGRQYIALYPQADNVAELKFNIANALYEEGNFREAIVRFMSLAEQYPDTREGQVAAQLSLDCYRLLFDMEGLARAGQRLLAHARIKDEGLRSKIAQMVAAAQQRQLDVLTVTAGTSERGAEALLSFAARNVGSVLGEKALLNAFMAAREQQDLAQLVKIGDQLLRHYPKSSEMVNVLTTLGKLTAQAAQFDDAARYLVEAARRETTAARGLEMERTAAVLLAQRGDRRGAEEGLRRLQQVGAPLALQLDVVQALAELYRRSGDHGALIELLKGYPQSPPELRMDGIRAQLQAGVPLDRLAPDLRALGGVPGAVGAEARLLLAELARQQLDAIAFGASRREDAKIIARRFALTNQVEAQYLSVVKLKQPAQVVGALGGLALLYQGTAKFLDSAPVPAGLSAADAARYREAFHAKAQPFARKAEEAIKTCADTAIQLKVFTPAAKACLSGQAPTGPSFAAVSLPPRPTVPEAPALRARLIKNPADGDALMQLALLHLKAGDLYGARLVVERALEVGGGTLSAAHNLAGVLAYQLGEPQEAFRHFQEALRTDRKNTRARLNLATLYREFGYSKLTTSEVGGLGDIPAELLRDPAVLPGASLDEGPAEKK